MNPLAGSGVFCAKAGETASRALRPSAAAMAVETTKSRRDRLSMGHLLEKNTPPAPLAPTQPRLGAWALYSRAKPRGEGGDAITGVGARAGPRRGWGGARHS